VLRVDRPCPWFRGELERIANDTLSPKKQEQMYLDSARLCAAMIRRLPAMEHITDRVALSEQLKHQQQEDRNRAKIYGRIAAQKQPRRFLQQCNILRLWQRAGGGLGITTPIKKRDDRRTPLPRGAVILYFQAVAGAIWGKAPSADRIKEIVREYRRTFKPGNSIMGGLGGLSADSFVLPVSKPSQALRR
jgi:hypothetical protein